MNRATEVFAALVCIVIGLAGLFAVSAVAYGIADNMQRTASAKSERQLCEERGGAYGELRGAGYHCFAKEAFK